MEAGLTLADLKHRQASAIAYELGDAPRTLADADGVPLSPRWFGATSNRRPARWIASLIFRCVEGHVGAANLTEAGIRCVQCSRPAVLTFPEDTPI